MDNETYLFHLGWWRAWALHSWVWGVRSQSWHLEVVRQHKILKIFRYFCSLILLICTSGIIVAPPRIVVKVTERMYVNCLACLVYSAAANSLQLCPTLCDPIDGSPPGSPVPGILQAKTLEWVAISFSNAWKGKVKVKSLSCVRLLAIPWTAAYQAPPSMGFSRQEYWSGVPLPSPAHSEYSINFRCCYF